MRSLILSLALAVAGISTASADPPSFGAGVTRITVQDATPFDALIAYPTEAVEVSVEEGPLGFWRAATPPSPPVLASRSSCFHTAATARGRRWFIAVFCCTSLGRVSSSSRRSIPEPGSLSSIGHGKFAALNSMLADPRFSKHADSDRIGMVGFSFGGAVTLIVAGANIDLAHLSAYCHDHADNSRACDGIATDGSWAKVPPSRKSDDALPLKALVLLEPYGALFDRKGLGSLDLPMLIYSASQSDLRAEGNTLALAKALPRPSQQVAVPGSHFVFVDPCSPILATRAPEMCSDPPGTDRAAIHQRFRREISDFLRANM